MMHYDFLYLLFKEISLERLRSNFYRKINSRIANIDVSRIYRLICSRIISLLKTFFFSQPLQQFIYDIAAISPLSFHLI